MYPRKSVDSSFKDAFTFEERKEKRSELYEKHPNYVPIICEKNKNSKLPDPPKIKFLIAPTMKMYHLIYQLRSSIKLNQAEALYLFVKGSKGAQLLRSDVKINEAYAMYKDEDDFLYLEYRETDFAG